MPCQALTSVPAPAVRQVDEDGGVLPPGFFDGLDPDEEVKGQGSGYWREEGG